MIPQFSNTSNISFLLWSENKLLTKGLAYNNYTSKLYYSRDQNASGNGLVAYASPFKQWVYDKSISGAQICESISGSISLSNGISGMRIDYENGRILLPISFGTGLNISGSYAFKDLNFYLANETEESLITSNKYYLNSRFKRPPTSGITPYVMATPAIFFNSLNSRQEDFALGGLYNSVDNVSLVVMAENVSILDSVFSIFRDTKNQCFVQLAYQNYPLDEFGNVKTGVYPTGYSYRDLSASLNFPGNLYYINSVRNSKLSDRVKASEGLFVGLIDIEISKVRQIT